MTGTMVISLDFEGMWGSLGSSDVEGFEIRTGYINDYVHKLLDAFEEFGIHATWGFVGAMLCESNDEVIKYLPKDVFYKKFGISVHDYIHNIPVTSNQKYYAKNLISEIQRSKNQEIASHTFSHFYTLESGTSPELFSQELNSFSIITKSLGLAPTTIIMPRNMINKEYLPIIKEFGYNAIRGRQKALISFGGKERNKVIDFLDAYFPIRRDLCYKYDDIECYEGVYNIKASMFFRTFDNRFCKFEKLKINRIKSEMRRAAKKNMIFHLWWHPHNMATNFEWNFNALAEILKEYSLLNQEYGFQSRNMSEVVQILNTGE